MILYNGYIQCHIGEEVNPFKNRFTYCCWTSHSWIGKASRGEHRHIWIVLLNLSTLSSLSDV